MNKDPTGETGNIENSIDSEEEYSGKDENIDIERLKEIQEKMTELLEEAEHIIRNVGNKMILDRAKAYWIPHIKTGLLNDTEYLGKSMVTMEDIISEIKENNEKMEGGDVE